MILLADMKAFSFLEWFQINQKALSYLVVYPTSLLVTT